MRMSRLFSTTLREAPSEAEVASHQLLLRAGFIRPLGSGIFSYLPLAKRCLHKIETILREEMDAIGGQEVSMPVVQPAENWKATRRWQTIGAELTRFKDRSGHDMLLAMTHEEAVADLARREIHSHRQLPQLIYHIQTKWRDDPRPRAGLLRVREFTMLDSYSLDADEQGLDAHYKAHFQAYFNLFHRCGLDVLAVKSDPGMMGGSMAHEFMFLTPVGEDSILICDQCGTAANRQAAVFMKPPAAAEELKPVEKVATPGCKTIEELADFLDVPAAKTAKAVFTMASFDGQADAISGTSGQLAQAFIFAVVRGDMELNETKLANAVGAIDLRPATEEEIRRAGAEPGYASPIGLRAGDPSLPVKVVIDEAVAASPNLVAGANQPDHHLLNTNTPRDYTPDLVVDIAAARAGCGCFRCGSPLRLERGVELGNIFKLGSRYTDALGCTFLDREGHVRPVLMGSYGIGLGRLLACIAEAHNDERGLKLPVSVTPYHVHLVLLRGKGSRAAEEEADRLYASLTAGGIEVLFDDRDESPGVKFNDADLIGCPLRLTVSERTLAAGQVEVKLRSQEEKTFLPIAGLEKEVRGMIDALQARLDASVTPVEYNG